MSATITALRISYFMVIKIIFFSEKSLIEVKHQHEILKCSKSSFIAVVQVEEAARRLQCASPCSQKIQIIIFHRTLFRTRGMVSFFAGAALTRVFTKVLSDSQERNPCRQSPSISRYATRTLKDTPLSLCQGARYCLGTASTQMKYEDLPV